MAVFSWLCLGVCKESQLFGGEAGVKWEWGFNGVVSWTHGRCIFASRTTTIPTVFGALCKRVPHWKVPVGRKL